MMKRYFFPVIFWIINFGLLHAQGWDHIFLPGSGRVIAFEEDANQLYALTSAGIYQSADEGYNWKIVQGTLDQTKHVRQFSVENHTLYFLNNYNDILNRGTISSNGEIQWKVILKHTQLSNLENEYMQTLFTKGDTVLLGTNYAIYLSTDKGEHWQQTLEVTDAAFESILSFKNEFFAWNKNNVYRASDGGKNWASVLTNEYNFSKVTATDRYLLALSKNRDTLFRSTDGMRTWDVINTEIISAVMLTSSYYKNILLGEGNNLFYFEDEFSCGPNFCYSSDGGQVWQKGNEGQFLSLGGTLSAGIFKNGQLILGGKTLYHSYDNANTFTAGQTNLKALDIRQIIRHKSNTILTDYDNYYLSTKDSGLNWSDSTALFLSGYFCHLGISRLETTQKRLFSIRDFFSSGTTYSENNGETWKTIAWAQSPYSPIYFGYATTPESLFGLRREDGVGFSFWRLSDTDSAITYFPIQNYTPENALYIYTSFEHQLVVFDGGKRVLFDENGKFIQTLPPSKAGSFQRLYYDGTNYYDICGSRTFILKQNASDWQEIYPQDWTTGIPLYHSPMAFIKHHKGVTWVGLHGKGLFYSTSDKGRFYPIEPQLPYPYPTDIAFEDNKLWVSTQGAGVFTITLPRVHLELEHKPVFQVFPNPSSGELQLKSNVFFTGETRLEVLDAAGRLVGTKTLAPGLFWDVEFPGLPGGMYFLRLKTPLATVGAKWIVH